MIIEAPQQTRLGRRNDYPGNVDEVDSELIQPTRLLAVSAADRASVKRQVINLTKYLRDKDSEEQHEDLMANLAFTLGSRRSQLEWRMAFLARSKTTLLDALTNAKTEPKRIHAKSARLCFVFTGQGSQWYAMGRELMRDFPVFAAVINEADRFLKVVGGAWSLFGS